MESVTNTKPDAMAALARATSSAIPRASAAPSGGCCRSRRRRFGSRGPAPIRDVVQQRNHDERQHGTHEDAEDERDREPVEDRVVEDEQRAEHGGDAREE